MTEQVYNGFKRDYTKAESIKKRLWAWKSIKIKNYSGKVFGGDVIFIAARDLLYEQARF